MAALTDELIALQNQHDALQRTPSKPVQWEGDSQALAAELRNKLRGEVRFDAGSRALYATDASNYRQVPIGVVIPRDLDDVVATVSIARKFGAPLLNRGGGTSLAGQCCNVAICIDWTKYLHKIVELDPDRKIARVEPGCVLDDLRKAANNHGLTFGPDPATHNHCTLGGMSGNNSCGMHAQAWGRVSENIEEFSILTYDGIQMRVGKASDQELDAFCRERGRAGDIYRGLREIRDRYGDLIRQRYPKIPRRVSGYNLDELLPENGFNVARALVGTEGTCVTFLEIKTKLVDNPKVRVLLVLGYPDVFAAGDHISEVVAHKPLACEGIDDRLLEYMHKKGLHVQDLTLLPEGNGWLMLEFGGESRDDAEQKARALMDELKNAPNAPSMKLYDDPAQEKMLWEVRESGLGATAMVPGEQDTWPGWEDSAVPPQLVGPYLRKLRKLYEDHGLNKPSLYGHFGQGCIHCRVPFELRTAQGLKQFRGFMEAATDLVLSFGGSLSGEHGDGQARAEFLTKMFGSELVEAFRQFKSLWDPEWKMNPGKVVDPYRIDENLRLGTSYNPPEVHTHFAYPQDRHSFAVASQRCVGIGECRREESKTMCPSYRATREEMHSTRGRARLLFEMMHGDPIDRGWRSEHVREALDLCLSCKGCKSDCPVNVDMATYKAEFLSHYYDGRIRPRNTYASGLIHRWCQIAENMPATANFFTQTPGLRSLTKWAAGYSQSRSIPPFAPQTFKQWFRARPRRNTSGPRVVLWPDTFNNHFTPGVAKAAVEVLEHGGYQVLVPHQDMCCGRPLYDYGMLPTAKRWLLNILETLRPEIEAGTPIVGLEPSCISVFCDEMTNLLPQNEDAWRLHNQSFFLSEFLSKSDGYSPPRLESKAIVHGHCHHKAVLHWQAEVDLLKKTGIDVRVLDSGCCGMAGAFGYEKDHYEVSLACGERELLPEVRDAKPDTLLITDGFSCREQIHQTTNRRALHFAQVLQLALKHEAQPERAIVPMANILTYEPRTPAVPPAVIFGAGLALGGAYVLWRRSRS
ncbi:MAG: FAD-binding protein [Bryobacterales bacterium]|nr:FAD-binding protein [Bryobacterales bacterium]MBV9401290.1 FAD-binding protein [Bryobacterales bacterium]